MRIFSLKNKNKKEEQFFANYYLLEIELKSEIKKKSKKTFFLVSNYLLCYLVVTTTYKENLKHKRRRRNIDFNLLFVSFDSIEFEREKKIKYLS